MQLLQKYMSEQRDTIMEHNVQVTVIGRREGLQQNILQEIDKTVALSRGNTGLKVCLAINYGGRAELVDAMRSIAGEVDPEDSIRPRSPKRPSMRIFIPPACPNPIC